MSFQLTYFGAEPSYLEPVKQFIDEWNAGETEFAVHTSGSTGKPKTIMLRREQLIASARRTIAFFGLKPGDVSLMALSPHVIGGKMMIIRAIEGHLNLIVTEPSANPLKMIPDDLVINFLPLVPLQLKNLIEKKEPKLKNVRTILLGGAPVPAGLESDFAMLDSNVFTGFGMTETVSHVAVRKAGSTVYEALEGVEFAEENEKLIVSDRLLEIEDLETSDSIKLIDNKHFEWLGREDFVINSGGVKIHPEQLETLLSRFIRGEYIIAGIPDDTFGEICILIAEKKLMGKLNFDDLQEFCRTRSGRYSVPKEVIYSEILKTPAGKIDRIATVKLVRGK